MINEKRKDFIEEKNVGWEIRRLQLEETINLVNKMKKQSIIERKNFFKINAENLNSYEKTTQKYRKLFKQMLGWPLSENQINEKSYSNRISEGIIFNDSSKSVYRIRMKITLDITLYGLLFVPYKKIGKESLLFALHGAKGCPELAGGLYGASSNYNDMVTRAVEKGFIVFVPQLNLWADEYGPNNQREDIDQELKMIGGSITSLEIYKLKEALSILIEEKYVNENMKIGIIGLSYGGMYALYTAALDLRFDAILSSCWLNEHPYEKGHSDWVFNNISNMFSDAQIATMVCPRALYLENGEHDNRFPPNKANEIVKYIEEIYSKLNIEENFEYHITQEKHSFDSGENGLNWLYNKLKS